MFNTILVCLDGSPRAEQILPYATQQAVCCHSKVILMQVTTIPEVVTPAIPGYGPSILRPSQAAIAEVEQEEDTAEVYLERMAQPLRDQGLEVECVSISGTPGEVIIGYAEEENIDLIALATHGRGGLGRLVVGSVADFVLRKTGKPVLLVKPR